MTRLFASLTAWWLTARSDLVRSWRWLRHSGPFYAASALAHGVVVAALVAGTLKPSSVPSAHDKVAIDTEVKAEIGTFELGTPSVRVTELSVETLALIRPPAQTEKRFDDAAVYEDAGGGWTHESTEPAYGGFGGFKFDASQRLLGGARGNGGVGVGLGTSGLAGSGGQDQGYHGQGHGRRSEHHGPLEIQDTERAVAAALNWLHRHQNADGSWSLTKFTDHCRDSSCGAAGHIESDTTATALALLPLLAAGQTHTHAGPYRATVAKGIGWLIAQQRSSGDLCGRSEPTLDSHALAALVLSEAYGMSHDERVGVAAQRAIRFIELAQNSATGGWQYRPGDQGDTATTGWQVMALRSGRLAGLEVDPICLVRAGKWFERVSGGARGGLVSYAPRRPVSDTMTALGLLGRQFLGQAPSDPPLLEAREYLEQNLPDEASSRDLLRSFLISHALHAARPDTAPWQAWNERLRRGLIGMQAKSGCAAGSWYPEDSGEIWSMQGGRVVTTSLAALTLAVSYRHLPLYQPDPPPQVHDRETRQRDASPTIRR